MSLCGSPILSQMPPTLDQYMGSQEAVASLLDLRSGLDGGSYMRSPGGQVHPSRRIEGLILISERIRDLFQQYVMRLRLDHSPCSLMDEQLLFSVSSIPAASQFLEIP